MPVLAVGGAQLVAFNRPIRAIARSQRILDDLGKDQHLHRARQFREPDERMMFFFRPLWDAAKFADACNRFSSNLDVSGL